MLVASRVLRRGREVASRAVIAELQHGDRRAVSAAAESPGSVRFSGRALMAH
jgi:hypothetical protein